MESTKRVVETSSDGDEYYDLPPLENDFSQDYIEIVGGCNDFNKRQKITHPDKT